MTLQPGEEGWWNGRVGDVFGILPATYIEAVTSVTIKFRAQGLYEFKVKLSRVIVGNLLVMHVFLCLYPSRTM